MAQRALLVGIDIYPYPPNNLNSCVNDTLAVRQLLMGTYGFTDITLLHNQDANYANVTAAIDQLIAGAAAGDQLVYFHSSHGYQYPDKGTMVECLCLYDRFLTDVDLSTRVKDVPAGVLTVVLDACHSGGMDKMFFPAGQPTLARAKVYQPSPEELAARIGVTSQVQSFKLFGRAVTRSGQKIIKDFDPARVFTDLPPAKDALDLELNATLLTACRADQTAAAGSLATDNLSAFTYGLTTQLDTDVSLDALNGRIGARLLQLNMSQVPQYFLPPGNGLLAQRTFIQQHEPTGTKDFAVDLVAQSVARVVDDLKQRLGTPADGVR